MIYRDLGRTGLRVSALGFGGMRLPMVEVDGQNRVDRDLAIPMLHRAFELGVNYVDTAVGYCNADSQPAIGEALVGWREKIVLSTKNPYYGPDESAWWANLETSLTRLGTDYIDVYHHHAINGQRYDEFVEPILGRCMRRAKEQGLIRHIATSFHDKPEQLSRILDAGYVEVITIQYNLLDRALEEPIAQAAEQGVGVVVMGPVGGGRLAAQSPALLEAVPGIERMFELALRFVLSNPGVCVALSGMSTLEQVEQNAAVVAAGGSLDAAEYELIDAQTKRLKAMADLYCSGCGYCLPCEAGVAIPTIFGAYNMGRVYGLWDHARQRYAGLGKRGPDGPQPADMCVECGACECKCPQELPIRRQLAEAHEALRGR